MANIFIKKQQRAILNITREGLMESQTKRERSPCVATDALHERILGRRVAIRNGFIERANVEYPPLPNPEELSEMFTILEILVENHALAAEWNVKKIQLTQELILDDDSAVPIIFEHLVWWKRICEWSLDVSRAYDWLEKNAPGHAPEWDKYCNHVDAVVASIENGWNKLHPNLQASTDDCGVMLCIYIDIPLESSNTLYK